MSLTISARDQVQLFIHDWSVPDPKLTVMLLHGYGEHAARYQHVANAWGERSIQVLAADLRGHGRSQGRRGYVDRFEDYHADADALFELAKDRAGDGPLALVGHSMGGLLAVHWRLARGDAPFVGVALSSPFLGLDAPNPVKAAAGRVFSKLVPKLSIDAGLHGRDVCRDAQIAELYDHDPLNNKKANSRWFTEVMRGIEEAHERAPQLLDPTILLYAGDDHVVDADATDRFASRLTMQDKEIDRLAGCYHEIMNEGPPVRAKIIARFADWLLARAT